MSLEVHIDWQGATHRVGRLHTAERSPAVTFEYAREWLARDGAFSIDPTGLPLGPSPIHGAALFGAMQDCGPDRWGRILIERAVRKHVLDRKPYREIDYVIALDDTARIGALRFRTEPTGPFLAATTGKLPPLVSLAALLRAADAIHGETETAADLRFLLGAGSPLGGARPKAAVLLADGQLAMAKFPKPDDVRDIAAGEVLALHLARQAGINVAESRLAKAGTRSVSVITRFDRMRGQRLPFLSANSLLGLSPGEAGAYTLLADGIRQFGDDVAGDLRELWRRLVFSLLASNYDDHLRNHGFLMRTPGKWSLSPAYDLNPVPEIERSQLPKTAISEDNAESSIQAALEVAPRFGLKPTAAKVILREAYAAVADWRQAAKRLRLPARTLAAYATAFENPLMTEAEKLR
ncbi:type II toxin-antitoxin system HipA family toxin [Oleiharenicola lentus]|uniref:Type II toxin-antitoxin system HipA family toxin n=1 Tax=Oleiharenicola lentus TaxID=2508720 RepID=A0A4Q1C5G9_9BACT|nr:type II toxin-antitoxin system HipA family toxin [Oleiharenicola lentus]RXK53651.1 type II toxin-antitoxin system HipA family toxin [Oleiharenicola lentus]